MKTKNLKYRHIAVALSMIMFFLVSGSRLWAGDDVTPFFAGAEGLPNIMFIFDNSDSMQDVPQYFRKDGPCYVKYGQNYRPSGWRWRSGVKVDGDGYIAESDGSVIYDQNAHTSTSEDVYLPPKTPVTLPPMPRTDGEPPSLTSTITKINRYGYWYLIYDENLDWDAMETDWNNKYRYCKIIIEDPGGGNPQVRTIVGYSKYSKYWAVYRYYNGETYDSDYLFDYLPGVETTDPCYANDSGECSTYDNSNPFTYTIVAGSPGEVTYPYKPTDENNKGRYVRDANIDWTQIDDATFNSTYKNRLLVVTAGTNAGESRRISWRSNDGKYWYVDPAFPENSDYTSRYKIVGEADDERQASGGNHPDSKLYQAKKALNMFLESDKIKVCEEKDESGNCIKDKYLINIGLATYLTARIPRVSAKYYKKVTFDNPNRCRAYYWRYADTSSNFYDQDGYEGGIDFDAWGTHYEDASVGDQIDRLYQEGACNKQTIHYIIDTIELASTDGTRHRIRLRSRQGYEHEGGYKYYNWVYFEVDDCADCTGYTYPDPYDEGNYEWHRAENCDADHPPGCVEASEGWNYNTNYYDTYGDYAVTDLNAPRYIDQDTLQVTPHKGHCSGIPGDDWLCGSPDPEAGNWTLVTETKPGGEVTNSDGTTVDITPYRYDRTYFRCPGYSDQTDHPHGWSYRKTTDDYIYRYAYYDSYLTTWGDSIAGQNSFPAEVGDERANHTGDDQLIFVNLPAYDADDEFKGDDVWGAKLGRIKNYISIARMPYPRLGYENYDCTMMPYNPSSLPVSSSTAKQGEGTPLADTLINAREYYASYFQQDDFTYGDCRKNYIILLTDGLETCGGDPVAAAAALNSPLIPDVPTSVVKTYVIGFGLDADSQTNLNAIAEAGGTGHAYFATNVEELVDVLTTEIGSQIIGDSYSRSSPVVSRIFSEDDELNIYHAYFDYPDWAGHLKKLNVTENEETGDTILSPDPNWSGDCDDNSGNDADAGCVMKTDGRGTVYTTIDGTNMLQFNAGNASSLRLFMNLENEDIDKNGANNEDADAAIVIEYTLDPSYDNNKYAGTRNPDWPLGDIYHSVPVVIPEPKLTLPAGWTGYEDDPGPPVVNGFKSDNADRPTMIYVGANDGMLHAINDSNGTEEWAYIPKCLLGTLYEFKEGHRFTVDLAIKGAEVDTSNKCAGGKGWWKTMIVSGLRKGGNHYYALDVTDPDNPLPMWEITDDNMGNTWSIPSFARINIEGDSTSVIIVGGGYSTTGSKGNRVYILKAATGEILKEIEVGSSTNNIPAEIYTMRYTTDSSENPVDYIDRSPVDPALKGFIEVAYFGGTNGILYKLTGLNTDADTTWDPQVEVLYAPPLAEREPIYHRVYVADYACCKKRFILFGTGDENEPTSVKQNYFYEIEDRAWDAITDETTYPEGEQGEIGGWFRLTWKETLENGEEVLSDPFVQLGTVYFTTYQPQGGCDMGYSYLYGLTTSTCVTLGGEAGLMYGPEGGFGGTPQKKVRLGKSIATTPVPAGKFLIIGDGDQTIDIPLPTSPGKLLYWRDIN